MCNLVTAYAAEQAAAKKLEILRVIADILGASEDDKQAVRADGWRWRGCQTPCPGGVSHAA